MNKRTIKIYAFWIFLAEAVGILAGLLTQHSIPLYAEELIRPPLSPPGAVFPIVWTVLYALMGIGAARIELSEPSASRTRALRLFLLQLAVNFLWSLVFFNVGAYGVAFFVLAVLWVLVFGMLRAFYPVDRTAALLQLPYLLWVTFAGYLNLGIWLLNG